MALEAARFIIFENIIWNKNLLLSLKRFFILQGCLLTKAITGFCAELHILFRLLFPADLILNIVGTFLEGVEASGGMD